MKEKIIPLLLYLSLSNAVKIWGPGLDGLRLPCTYFFLQLEDDNGNNITNSADDKLEAAVEGEQCRSWTEIFNRNDGFFIVRYKIYNVCDNMKIKLKLNGKKLLDPIPLKSSVLPDVCNCPKGTLEDWYKNSECKVESEQLKHDLDRFENGVNISDSLERAKAAFNNPGAYAWCHYVIKDTRIYRKCYGEHVGFSMFWDAILAWMARHFSLPDLEMLVNLGDWPLVKRNKKKYEGIAMFSWCGSRETSDIIFPTYELTEASLECMGRQSLDVLSAMGKNAPRWEDKTDKMFWRGRDSRRERLDLIEIGRQRPELINASITNFFFFRTEMEKYGGGSPSVPFFQFFDHKYQLNIDGTVAAYRLPYLLAGNSVVLKQESGYYEHFYADLQPWVHYIPVKADLSDLVERIHWARDNDDKAKKISANAQQFVLDNLLPHHVFCYHANLLQAWSSKLLEKVEVREGMEEVEIEKDTGGRMPPCRCDRDTSKTEL